MTSQYTQQDNPTLRDAQPHLEERRSLKHDPIAIIGMSCRLPGGVTSPAGYWQLLQTGRSGIVRLGADELRHAGVDPASYERPDYVGVAATLEDIEHFDGEFFGIARADLELMDPQHRLMLQGVWEALENAGYGSAERRGVVGLFGGCGINHYFVEKVIGRTTAQGDTPPGDVVIGNEKDYLVSRIAYLLDLRGPAVNVQSACSTSLVAAHYAVQSLRLGECDIAVAGGVAVKVPHQAGYFHHGDSIRSLKGECRAFDQGADGTVLGNGLGVVVLKPLQRALEARDHIYAVIKGSAVNNDGSDKVSFSAPSVSGQERVIVAALENAGVDPASIQYLEAHGTGTRLGDPIEIAAATKAFRHWTRKTGFCALGSVKSNLGHADAAAGMAGLMKAALSLFHRTIPPTLHCDVPNPTLSLFNSPFYINTSLRPWPQASVRRAAVSSFGIGGTNSHMVLEEAPAISEPENDRKYYILPLSARAPQSLSTSGRMLADHLERHPDVRLPNAAYTLAVGRKEFSYRHAIVARDPGECIAQLRGGGADRPLHSYQPLRNVPVVFLFPGHDVELTSAGRSLYNSEHHYRRCVEACVSAARRRLDLDIGGFLDAPDDRIDPRCYPLALFITEYALARMWMANGIQPRYLLGEGLGEYAAACVAEVMSLEDALWMVARRTELTGEPFGVVEAFASELAQVGLNVPKIPMLLNVTGREATADDLVSSRYWVNQLTQPPRFDECVSYVIERSSAVFLELGPGATLSTRVNAVSSLFSKECIASLPTSVAAHSSDSWVTTTLGKLWLSGVSVNWEKHYEGSGYHRIPLLTYPFEKQRYWLDKQPRGEPGGVTPKSAQSSELDAEHFYLPVWKRVPFVLESALAAGGSCLFFDDGSELARSIKEELHALDVTLLVVGVGSEFARSGPHEYRIQPDSESDYEQLVGAVLEAGPIPQTMLHLWGLGASATEPAQTAGSDGIESSFWSLYSFLRAWTRLGGGGLRAGVLSGGVENVTGEEPLIAEKSLVLGGCHAIQHELVRSQCRHFDIRLKGTPTRETLRRVGVAVVREVLSDSRTLRVAYRDGHRWILDLQQIKPVQAPTNRVSIREGGVYWITGGLGGIGLELADFMTRQANVSLYLIQRTEFPESRDWDSWLHGSTGSDRISASIKRIRLMESRGSKVTLVCADVSDSAAMRRLYERTLLECGWLHGVIHAAGVPGGGLLSLKPRADVEAVLRAKVLGTRAIEGALRPHPKLDFFVLCSSVTALLGGAGRSDYCAANCFLDAFATESSRSGHRRVISINWDAWRETGMAITDSNRSQDHAGPATAPLHPLLEELASTDDTIRLFRTRFNAATHWIVHDHRIRGMPTLPGVAYIEMIAAALFTENVSLEIRDLRFLQPLVLADAGAAAFMEVARSADGSYRIGVFRTENNSSDRRVWHAEATAVLVNETAAGQVDVNSLAQSLPALDPQSIAGASGDDQNAPTLQLGPAWNVRVLSCHAGTAEFMACLELPEILIDTAAHYVIQVPLLDVATSFALGQFSHDGLYLPLGYERLRIHRKMPQRIYSHVTCLRGHAKAAETMEFDIRIFDTDGREIVTIETFVVKRVADIKLPAPAIHQSVRYGLSNSSGARAFSRVIEGDKYPQVIVSATAFHDVDRSARAEARPPSNSRPDLRTPYQAPSDDVERKLALLWQTALGLDRVGVNDDFMELGGDSLTATRLVDKIVAELNVNISIVSFYDKPTIRQLAQLIHGLAPEAAVDPGGEGLETTLFHKARVRKEFLDEKTRHSA